MSDLPKTMLKLLKMMTKQQKNYVKIADTSIQKLVKTTTEIISKLSKNNAKIPKMDVKTAENGFKMHENDYKTMKKRRKCA